MNTYKRAFSVFNSSAVPTVVTLSIAAPFSLNDGSEKISVQIPPNKRKIYYVTLKVTEEMVRNPDLFKFKFDNNKNVLFASSILKSTGLELDVEFECKSQISLPKVKISKTDFDFGTCFINDKFTVNMLLSIIKDEFFIDAVRIEMQ